ncbi:MAG: putative Type IV pilus pilin [Parcubacteria bacterium C7867-003]|nr:MAG: putative Type IV pilus pilin [Parcubacteria bacterium C7867-003]
MARFKINSSKGFTLIEIMVSVSIFAVIMLMVSSSIYTVFDSNRKSQSLRAVMDNLNLSLESMTRTIRFGRNYHCDLNVSGTSPNNCSSGASSMQLTNFSGSQVLYQLCTTGSNSGRVARSNDCTNGPFITGSDVTISKLMFYVLGANQYVAGAGSCPGSNDCLQPRVVIVLEGYAGTKLTSRSSFSLQTTVSQRLVDVQ